MERAAKTSIILGAAAWLAVLGQVLLLLQMAGSDETADGIGSFVPVLLLSFASLGCVVGNIVFGIIAWKRAGQGPKPVAGLLLGAPIALFFLVAMLAQPLLG